MKGHEGLRYWLDLGERGLSSNAMVEKLVHGRTPRAFDYPADPGDLRRCELLLRSVPTLRPLLPKMAEVSSVWAGLVARWDELVALMEEECPSVWGYRPTGSSPKAYRIMRDIVEAAR